jgi:4a-hydroxytetrahydrobiopterin dehydratase
LSELQDWKTIEGKLCKDFQFRNFVEAFGFISKIALEAEKMDHHPEITNVYNKVEIKLVTHDLNQISEKDISLAKKIDKLNA